MPPTDNAPTTEQYQQLCQQTQAKLATLDFASDADYREGMDALGELNRQGALLKLAEASGQSAGWAACGLGERGRDEVCAV